MTKTGKIAKRSIALVCILLLCASAFANVLGGTVGGTKVAKTQHFDIIYQDGSLETASLIFSNCESLYNSLVDLFGQDPKAHIPVVITLRYKILNAYYTSYPANHIVLFDTVSSDPELGNFDQTILDIFRHELTHFFQFNLRGPVFNVLSKIFGDGVSLASILYLYPSLSEGGAVLSESLVGRGRINNSYSMQIIKQAKLEGYFPTWIEVAGARDTYPAGLLYYNFAGAFLDYLSLTYGIETVMSIYKDFEKLRLISTPEAVIESHIGIPVSEAWDDFYRSIDVPDRAEIATEVDRQRVSTQFSTLQLAPDGSIFVYDQASESILRYSSDLTSSTTILHLPSTEAEISLSSDGKFMLFPYITSEKTEVRLYDISSGKAKLIHKFLSTDLDCRSASFVELNGVEQILLYCTKGQSTFLQLYSASDFTPIDGKNLYLGFDTRAKDFSRLSGNRVAFILNHAAKDNIAILSLETMTLSLLDNTENLQIVSLSTGNATATSVTVDNEVLSFCWYPEQAKASNLVRYGEVRIGDNGGRMSLSVVDVLGGVQGAVRSGGRIVFFSSLYQGMVLAEMDVQSLRLKDVGNLGLSRQMMAQKPDTVAISEVSRPYHAIKYFLDGVLFPIAFVNVGSASSLGFGLTWLTTDPTETFTHQIAAGYSSGDLIGSYQFTFDGRIPFSAFVSAGYGFGSNSVGQQLPKGAKYLATGAQSSLSFKFDHSSIKLDESFSYEMFFLSNGDFKDSFDNNISLTYDFLRSTSASPYGYFELLSSIYIKGISPVTPGLNIRTHIPHLMWWKCTGANTTNMPLTLSLGIEFLGGFNKDVLLSGSANLLLYGREIQRGISFLSLYFRRFELTATYHATWCIGTGAEGNQLLHNLDLTGLFTLSPVLGGLFTRVKTSLGATLSWQIHSGQWQFGLAMDVNL